MENIEKELPDFIAVENSTRNSFVEGNGTFEEARNYIEIIAGNPCGTFGAPYLNLRNKSNDKKIGVTIEVRWMYNNRPRTESRIYNTFPGQVVGLGCPIPGPTAQRFDYILIAAWFI